MNDRELLEYAAKAAGMEPSKHDGVIYAGFGSRIWNPLTDDGDALRLAVKLKMDVEHNGPLDNDPWVLASRRGCEGCFSPVSCIEDAFDEQQRAAATRRVIVRAAAEIGKQMALQEMNNEAEKNGEPL